MFTKTIKLSLWHDVNEYDFKKGNVDNEPLIFKPGQDHSAPVSSIPEFPRQRSRIQKYLHML